jgi:hypothetical protein
MTCTFGGFAKWILPPIIIFFLCHTSRKKCTDSALMCSPRVKFWHFPVPCALHNITCHYPVYGVLKFSGWIRQITRNAAASILCNNACRLKNWSQRSVEARVNCPALQHLDASAISRCSPAPKWFIISMFATYLERKPPRKVTFRSRQRDYFYWNSVRLPAGVVHKIASASPSLPLALVVTAGK